MSRLSNIKFTPLLDTLRLQKISDAEYFSASYSDYISNSRLKDINPKQEGSIQKFLDGMQAHRLFLPSLPLGSAVHEMILQPEYFELRPEITSKPSAKAGFVADEILSIAADKRNPTKDEILRACSVVDYYSGLLTDTQYNNLVEKIMPYINDMLNLEHGEKEPIILDVKQMQTAKLCIEALENNQKVQELLHPAGCISENEQAILLDVNVSLPDLGDIVVRLKSKLDNYTIDKFSNTITVNDIKTHGRTVDTFDNSMEAFHYMREMGMYSYLLKLCADKFYDIHDPVIKSNFLVVSTIPQYYTKVVPMTEELFKRGFYEFRYLLKLAAVALYFKNERDALVYLNEYTVNDCRQFHL